MSAQLRLQSLETQRVTLIREALNEMDKKQIGD